MCRMWPGAIIEKFVTKFLVFIAQVKILKSVLLFLQSQTFNKNLQEITVLFR